MTALDMFKIAYCNRCRAIIGWVLVPPTECFCPNCMVQQTNEARYRTKKMKEERRY